MHYILAIDQSTSGTKAVLFDAAGQVVDRASCEHRQIYPQPGWVEHDAEEIWQNVLAVIGELAEQQRNKVADAAALAISNQRETFVVFDRETGRPLHHAIVWQDRRGEPICRELASGEDGPACQELIRRKTGLKLDTYFPASKIKWLLENHPQVRQRVQAGNALVGTIDAYLVYRLTGGREFVTDPTNASRTLLFDVARLQWDVELCNVFGVPTKVLPEVRESFSYFGETEVGHLPRRLPICGVMGDSQASLFAQQCYRPGEGKATFGTGTSVLVNVGEQFRPTHAGAVSALAWVYQQRPTYALEGLINYSSATVSWLKDQLGLIHEAVETEPLARSVEDNGGVYLVPAFAGLSAPYWRPDARAAIVGMTAHTTKAHLVRAALEAIAYQVRDVLEMIACDAGVTPSVLRCDGGPTRNEFLMQFTADLTGMELAVADVPESSALGAALAGMLGSEMVSSLAELESLPRGTRNYRRLIDPAEADRLYAGWQTAVRRVLVSC